MLHKTCCFNAKEKRIDPGQSLLLFAFNLGVPISLCQYSFVVVKYHLQSGLTANAFIWHCFLHFIMLVECHLNELSCVTLGLLVAFRELDRWECHQFVLKGPKFIGTPIGLLLKSHLLLQCRRRRSFGSFRESSCQACSRCDSFKLTFYPPNLK